MAGSSGALPLEWTETAEDPSSQPEGAEDDGREERRADTIDLTERASRDDFAVWSDVLRRRPVDPARFTRHPSAAGERLRAATPATPGEVDDDDDDTDDDLAGTFLARRRRRRRRLGRSGTRGSGERDTPASVSRLPVWPGEPEGSGAEVVVRVVTGVVVAAACLLAFNAGRGPAAWLCAGIVGFAVVELSAALRSQGYRPAVPIALAGSVGLVLGGYTVGPTVYPLVLFLVVATSLLWHLVQVVRGRPVMGIGMTLVVFGYVGCLGGFAGLLLGFEHGVGMLIGLAICTVAYDVCGYAAGRRFGRRPLTSVSPNKTVEGLLAGMAGSMILSVAIVGLITPWDRLSALALGALVAVIAPLGDLCESMLKRDLGVKDLGGILPGHGGVLDRFDAILFSLPAVYYLVRILELG